VVLNCVTLHVNVKYYSKATHNFSAGHIPLASSSGWNSHRLREDERLRFPDFNGHSLKGDRGLPTGCVLNPH